MVRYPCSWFERISIIKMSILSKAICRFNTSSIKIPMTFFTEPEKIMLKCIWNHKRPRTVKAILRKTKQMKQTNKKPQSWKYQAPRLQIILQSYSNQNSIVLAHKNRHIDQWNRIESPEKNPMHL